MPIYMNPHGYTVHLTGPNGEAIQIASRKSVELPEYYEKYCKRGFIRIINEGKPTPPIQQTRVSQGKINLSKRHIAPPPSVPTPTPAAPKPLQRTLQSKAAVEKAKRLATTRKREVQPRSVSRSNKIVGRPIDVDPTSLLRSNIEENNYPISNNIGVGILSYNRGKVLERLVNSIIQKTDLRKTTIFISDDCSDDQDTVAYLDSIQTNRNIVIIRNKERLGVAGNSNRLLRCLKRFRYGMLLNDDVEVLDYGWDIFYFDVMNRTKMHHFIFRQPGVYGAALGDEVKRGGVILYKVDDKPHGAVLAFTNEAFSKIGYFDESYGLYGMEHVDWSQKMCEFGLQEPGFFDVEGSVQYFKLHSDDSSVSGKSEYLRSAREKFSSRKVQNKCDPSPATAVPSVSYVIPFRNIDRSDSIGTVVNGVRGQKFPAIQIIMVEQDAKNNIDLGKIGPVDHWMVLREQSPLFNKSAAFNFGVSKADHDVVILHDADMLAQGHYTSSVFQTLAKYDSCHIGGRVIYSSKEATDLVNSSGVVDNNVKCDRVIGYFEGGSLASRTKAYWKVGAFNEDYYGYGCEDCDFYARLSAASNWLENRSFDFLHLWHGRVSGWEQHHKENRDLEAELSKLPIAERVLLQHRQLSQIGYGNLVRGATL